VLFLVARDSKTDCKSGYVRAPLITEYSLKYELRVDNNVSNRRKNEQNTIPIQTPSIALWSTNRSLEKLDGWHTHFVKLKGPIQGLRFPTKNQ
jgi:hypothetical protein